MTPINDESIADVASNRNLKEIIILSSSKLLSNSIKDNSSVAITDMVADIDITSPCQFLFSQHKIDLLIIDIDDFELAESEYYKIKTIVNLTNKNKFSNDEIKLSKPFRLGHLLKVIEGVNTSQDIFCAINCDFTYNERLRTLNSRKKLVKFTEKENEIFKFILLSPDFKIEKESLLKNVWRYHENSESSTVDTHLYKLKLKLPDKMLEIKGNICHLNII